MDIQISEAHRNRITLSLYWGIRVLLGIAAAFFLWRIDVASAGSTILILLITLIPALLKKRYRFYIPFALDLALTAFVFATLFLGEVARFYDRLPFWDKFLHFQSGFLLGSTGYVLIYILNKQRRMRLTLSPVFISLFAVSFSIAIGALWEIVEFTIDSIAGAPIAQHGLSDTMWDLIADTVGSILFSVLGYFWMYRHKRLPFTPWLIRILNQISE